MAVGSLPRNEEDEGGERRRVCDGRSCEIGNRVNACVERTKACLERSGCQEAANERAYIITGRVSHVECESIIRRTEASDLPTWTWISWSFT